MSALTSIADRGIPTNAVYIQTDTIDRQEKVRRKGKEWDKANHDKGMLIASTRKATRTNERTYLKQIQEQARDDRRERYLQKESRGSHDVGIHRVRILR